MRDLGDSYADAVASITDDLIKAATDKELREPGRGHLIVISALELQPDTGGETEALPVPSLTIGRVEKPQSEGQSSAGEDGVEERTLPSAAGDSPGLR